jgi:putative endonuclease
MSSWTSISPADFGRRAELVAAWWLRARGYRVLGRNVKVGGREVDIVAIRGRVLVVCEVKARRHDGRGASLDAVNESKQRRLYEAGEMLFERHPYTRELRFDVITVDGLRIRHVRDAFS